MGQRPEFIANKTPATPPTDPQIIASLPNRVSHATSFEDEMNTAIEELEFLDTFFDQLQRRKAHMASMKDVHALQLLDFDKRIGKMLDIWNRTQRGYIQ